MQTKVFSKEIQNMGMHAHLNNHAMEIKHAKWKPMQWWKGEMGNSVWNP